MIAIRHTPLAAGALAAAVRLAAAIAAVIGRLEPRFPCREGGAADRRKVLVRAAGDQGSFALLSKSMHKAAIAALALYSEEERFGRHGRTWKAKPWNIARKSGHRFSP